MTKYKFYNKLINIGILKIRVKVIYFLKKFKEIFIFDILGLFILNGL